MPTLSELATWDWNFAISLFANSSVTAFVLAFAVSAAWISVKRWSDLMSASRMGMLALTLLALFIIVRAGFWAPTMWLSDVGTADRYHPGWIQFRWVSYTPASILGLAAAITLAIAILRWRTRTAMIVLAACIGIGTLTAASWILSENGYWFDRQQVIEWHDRVLGYERAGDIE